MLDFNPRSREGSDPILPPSISASVISIHAPARGATVFLSAFGRHIRISIHAPARGATQVHLKFAPCSNISIHAPARGATKPNEFFIANNNISIHAPARGATIIDQVNQHTTYISIHAPARGATVFRPTMILQKRYFNPRSREGSDVSISKMNITAELFQSTLPRGERPDIVASA